MINLFIILNLQFNAITRDSIVVNLAKRLTTIVKYFYNLSFFLVRPKLYIPDDGLSDQRAITGDLQMCNVLQHLHSVRLHR